MIAGIYTLTLAHLWRDGSGGRGCGYCLRVRRIVRLESERAAMTREMVQLVESMRIEAEVDIMVSAEPPLDVIGRASAAAAAVLVGLAFEVEDVSATVGNSLERVKPLVAALKGDVSPAKSWHDFHLDDEPER